MGRNWYDAQCLNGHIYRQLIGDIPFCTQCGAKPIPPDPRAGERSTK